MSLATYLAKAGEELGPAAEWAKRNKVLLGAGGAAAAGTGLGLAAQPMIENYAADKAVDRLKNQGLGAVNDTLDFAQKHPYIASGALGLSGLIGGGLGGGDEEESTGNPQEAQPMSVLINHLSSKFGARAPRTKPRRRK